ncbi:MAG TPA: DUF296 domain-containing protein, partial [Rhabdochlamydiaceae bacterium]|nr:DUF296 domain-containing protein [Rhabdochlamydiaceae bacterium]
MSLVFFALAFSALYSSIPFREMDVNMVNEKMFLPTHSFSSKITAHVFRLRPGQDFIEELKHWAKQNRIRAGAILSVV